MCLASTTRQPCSVGSCMAVTRNWPFGLNGDVMVRALPLQHLGRGLRVRKPQRHAVVVGDGEPHALRRERQPADGGGHLERARLALAGHARRPACRPTRRPRRPGRRRHGRSSGAWRRSRSVSLSPFASVANTLPSSPPVTTRVPSLAAARMPPPWTRKPLLVALAGDQQQRLLAEHERRGAAEEMHGHHRRAGGDRRVRRRRRGCWGRVSHVGRLIRSGEVASRRMEHVRVAILETRVASSRDAA